MTLSVSTQVGPVGAKLVVDTEADETANNNVTGQADTVYMVEVDNTANAAASYLKLYDAASCVPGTDPPNMIMMVPASVSRVLAITEGIAFATGISYCCVTSPGTAGVVGPTNPVVLRMVTS